MAARALTPEQRAERNTTHARAFFDDVARLLPEGSREAFTQLRTTLEGSPEATQFIASAVLRQQEGSRLVNDLGARTRELESQRSLLNEWWRDNEAAARVGALAMQQGLWDDQTGSFRTPARSAGDDGGDDPAVPAHDPAARPAPVVRRTPETPMPAQDPARYLTREEAANLENGAITLTAQLTTIAARHLREFNESLDANDLIQFARDSQLPVDLAYDRYVGDRRSAAQQRRHEEALAAAREEGRQAALREQQPTPYPSPTQANATLARINQPLDTNEHGVAAAVRDYQQLTQPGR